MYIAPNADRWNGFTSPNVPIPPHIPGGWRFKGITDNGEAVTWYAHDIGVWIFTQRNVAEFALDMEVRT